MSQDWIKIETHTVSKVEVAKIAFALKNKRLDRFGVLGRLVAIWSYFDNHTYDGVIDGVGPDYLDDLIGTPGFCEAMKLVGWIKFEEADGASRVTLPNFDRHNGETAKKRAMAGKRQGKHRDKSNDGSVTKVTQERDKSNAECNATALQSALPDEIREDEIREDEMREDRSLDQKENSLTDPSGNDHSPEWLARVWSMQCGAKRGRVVRDKPEDISPQFAAWIKFGVPPEAIAAELKKPGTERDFTEHLWQFKQRLFDRLGLSPGRNADRKTKEQTHAENEAAFNADLTERLKSNPAFSDHPDHEKWKAEQRRAGRDI